MSYKNYKTPDNIVRGFFLFKLWEVLKRLIGVNGLLIKRKLFVYYVTFFYVTQVNFY